MGARCGGPRPCPDLPVGKQLFRFGGLGFIGLIVFVGFIGVVGFVGLRVWGLGFSGSGLGFRVSGFGFIGFRVWGLGLRVSTLLGGCFHKGAENPTKGKRLPLGYQA